MHFYNEINEIASKKDVCLFIDMDGVIAAYAIGKNPYDFVNKRPLTQNIKNIEEVTKIPNVELHILSICRENTQVDDKNVWLDKYAPFFKKENRILISREANGMTETAVLKAEYMKNIERDGSVMILIDDDPRNLKEIRKQNEDVLLLKDTALID